MHLYERVDEALTEAIARLPLENHAPLPGSMPQLRTTQLGKDGFDRQCAIAMPLAKRLGVDAKALAAQLADELRQNTLFSDVQVAGPGFINMQIAEQAILEHGIATPNLKVTTPGRIIIDFGGPNIAKALHVGHLRSLVIGESLRRILLARGHQVTSDIHFGDWGLPMGMLIAEIRRRAQLPSETEIVNGFFETLYPRVVQACRDDPDRMAEAQRITVELQNGDRDPGALVGRHEFNWNMIRSASLWHTPPYPTVTPRLKGTSVSIMSQVQRLGAHFDLLNGESNAAPASIPNLRPGLFREDKGAIVIDVAEPDDKKKMPPVIFQKSDGGYTYAATDLATMVERWERRFTKILYVTDDRQILHFQQVIRAFRALKLPSSEMDIGHVVFGTVNGTDGKPFKTRDGGVPSLQWMLDEAVTKAAERTTNPENAEKIGIGAVKFADLITNRTGSYVFDLDRIVVPEGKTGPYVQYACVRIGAILKAVSVVPWSRVVISDPTERNLLLACANFPEAVALAENHLLPTFIAEYAFTLAQRFSQFYIECKVIGEPEEQSRVAICNVVLRILSRCLDLLGIEIPSEM